MMGLVHYLAIMLTRSLSVYSLLAWSAISDALQHLFEGVTLDGLVSLNLSYDSMAGADGDGHSLARLLLHTVVHSQVDALVRPGLPLKVT